MIELKEICKSFGENSVIKNFNYKFEEGFYIIKGPSGSGKTTLLNIIGLLEKYDSGELVIDGVVFNNIFDKKAKPMYKEYFTYVFQDFLLDESLSVEKNLKLVTEDKHKISEALYKVNLEDKMNDKCFNLSGGEKQRVAIARALLKDAKFLLVDEPISSLDTKNAKEVMKILRSIEGVTVIMVSHNLEFAKDTDTIIEFSDINNI